MCRSTDCENGLDGEGKGVTLSLPARLLCVVSVVTLSEDRFQLDGDG